jgi:hypothetical protein
VKPIDDSLVEGEETVVAQLTGSPLDCATCGYNIGAPSNAVVVISNNDQTNSALHFVDPDSPPLEARFYRAAPEPSLDPDD